MTHIARIVFRPESVRNILRMDSTVKFGLYPNLQEILNVLNNPEFKGVSPVVDLLHAYNITQAKFDAHVGVKKFPLIVLEGLDGSGKTTLGKALARKIHAEKCSTPPEKIRPIRDYFDNNTTLRSAYYSLGNYIAGMEVSCLLTESPIVMDRFWHSTMAFAIAQGIHDRPGEMELPEESDNIYKWPSDLLVPDRVILLVVSEAERLRRHARRNTANITQQEIILKSDITFRQNVIEAYKRMREPSVTVISGDESFGKVLYLLKTNVQPLMNS